LLPETKAISAFLQPMAQAKEKLFTLSEEKGV
jgi:hypothetical protein